MPPLGLYIHIPWCEKKCPYCDFNSHGLKGKELTPLIQKNYAAALKRDLKDSLNRYPHIAKRKLCSVFIGGGTPSLMSPAFYDEIFTSLSAEFDLTMKVTHSTKNINPTNIKQDKQSHILNQEEDPLTEITLEANPSSAEYSMFTAYRKSGINRLSLGVQSFNDDMLKKLGRIHSADEAQVAFYSALDAGFSRINLDIIYGLPNQSVHSAINDLKKALCLNPQHISWYCLTIEPNTFFAVHPPFGLPDDKNILSMELQGANILQEHGYCAYEVAAWTSNFKTGRAIHNLNYWQFGDYLGIGAGAHSKISRPDGTVIREWRWRHPEKYQQAHNQRGAIRLLRKDDLIYEFMLNALRLYDGFDEDIFVRHSGLPFEVILPQIKQAQELMLIEYANKRVFATARGRDILNDLILLFAPNN